VLVFVVLTVAFQSCSRILPSPARIRSWSRPASSTWLAVSRRTSSDLHLNQWTTGRDVAFADGVWEAAKAEPAVPDGTEVVLAFVAARQRDTVAIVGCTLEKPHAFPIRIWEEAERVDPSDVAEELRAVWARYSVREFLCSEADWTWVLLMLAEEGLPVTKVPRSPQRPALQWSQFYDAVLERRLTHDGDRVLARHVSNLALISGPSGPRPDLDVAEGPTGRGGPGGDGRLRRRGADRTCRGADGDPA